MTGLSAVFKELHSSHLTGTDFILPAAGKDIRVLIYLSTSSVSLYPLSSSNIHVLLTNRTASTKAKKLAAIKFLITGYKDHILL